MRTRTGRRGGSGSRPILWVSVPSLPIPKCALMTNMCAMPMAASGGRTYGRGTLRHRHEQPDIAIERNHRTLLLNCNRPAAGGARRKRCRVVAARSHGGYVHNVFMHRLASPPVPPTAGWKERLRCGVRAILQSHSPTAQGRGGLQTNLIHPRRRSAVLGTGRQGRGGLQTNLIHPRRRSAVLGTGRQGRGGLQTNLIHPRRRSAVLGTGRQGRGGLARHCVRPVYLNILQLSCWARAAGLAAPARLCYTLPLWLLGR
jgi:hypothetical protein